MKVQARQIDRVFSKRFLDSLLEERSVSREAQSEANELGECMEEIVDSIEPQYNDQGIAVVDGTNDTELFGKDIRICFKIYLFRDFEAYKKQRRIINYFYKYFNQSKTIHLTIVVIAGKVMYDTNQTKLAHEILHALQYEKSGKELLHNEKYYQNIEGLTQEQDEIIYMIKYIIYMSSHYEQEAYANELYSELNMRKPENYLDVLSRCNGYLSYKNLETYYNRIKELKDDELVKKTLEDYGYSIGYFLKNAEVAVKNFSRRIGRVVSLWIDENRPSSSTIY